MQIEALLKAQQRFDRARHARGMISAVLDFEGFEACWSEFLTAGNGVHTALEKGAKDSPKSRQWFGGKKRERREDPLLSYMHQARNADEHGLEPVAALGAGIRGTAAFKGRFAIGDSFRTREGIFGFFSSADKAAELFQITPPAAILVPVHNDIFGDTFEPQKSILADH
jgi:hypothetical protein